jgi:hypothetical protein
MATDQEHARLIPEDRYGLGQDTGGDWESRAREAHKIMLFLVEFIGDDRLSIKEQMFIQSVRDRQQRTGRATVSGKQLFWLRDILDKVTQRGWA